MTEDKFSPFSQSNPDFDEEANYDSSQEEEDNGINFDTVEERITKHDSELSSMRVVTGHLQNQMTRLAEKTDILGDRLIRQSNEIVENSVKTVTDKLFKTMSRFIEQEINTQLSDNHLREFIRHHVKNTLTSEDLNDIISDIVKQILDRMDRTLHEELDNTKKLCYSIDNEVKKSVRGLPISYKTEKIIVEKIEQTLNGFNIDKVSHDKIEKNLLGFGHEE